MELLELRALLDFGMVVLLWLVQRVIYPSFLKCPEDRLVQWHKTYIKRVGPIIIPMMLVQLPVVSWVCWVRASLADLAALACLVICWILTFAVSVPLHNKIDAGDTSRKTLDALVATNWPRTILWTATFVLGFV